MGNSSMLNLLEDDGTSLSPKNDREFIPQATNGAALGSATVMWSDLFLAEGGIINFNNGNQTITHSLGTLTTNGDLAIAGALSGVTTLGMSGVLTTAGAIDITIADEGDDIGLTVTNNDVTNNPNSAVITNATTGKGLQITQTGNGQAIQVNHSGTTSNILNLIGNSLTTGSIGRFYSNSASFTAIDGLLDVYVDNPLASGHGMRLRQDGTGYGIVIDHNNSNRALDIDQDVPTHTTNLDFNTANFVRTSTATSTSTNTGAVLRLVNQITLSDTATDTTNVLELVQDADSTGVPISVTQNAVTSTNFKKVATFAGLSIWVSDGTTAEGALTGVEGDICLNGGTGAGQTAYCDAAGTNWTDM